MAVKCLTILGKVFQFVFIKIPVFLSIFIASLLVPILVTPFILYRLCLKYFAKLFRPELENILAFGNTIMASYDEIYSCERNDNTTVIVFKVAGNLEIEEVRKIAAEKLINARTAEGILKYPELKQFPVKWMGYYFWKPEANFDIKRHVDYYAPPEKGNFYTDEEAAAVEAELVTKSHIKENSPWQIVILPNVKSNPEDVPTSIVYFRTHHGLMDGFSVFQLFIGELGGFDLVKLGFISPSPNLLKRIQNILYYSFQYFRVPFGLAYNVVQADMLNEFRLGYDALSREQTGTIPIRIPLVYLKDIKKSQNVDLGNIIISSWIGGLRRTMLDRGMKIPEVMHFGCPFPIPGHSGKLRVHASAATISLPIGIKDPVKRLKAIDKYMKYIKGSSYAQAIYIYKSVLGFLPSFLIDIIIPRIPPTGAMNIFSATNEPFSIFGKEVIQLNFSYGQQKFRSSILFSSLSYCGTVAMKIAVNKNIFSDPAEINQMNQFVLEELDFLNKHTTV